MIGNQVALEKERQKQYGIATFTMSIFVETSASRYIMSEGELEYGWGLTMKEVEFGIVLLAWFGLGGVWFRLGSAVFVGGVVCESVWSQRRLVLLGWFGLGLAGMI
jgi:hypothetical protein